MGLALAAHLGLSLRVVDDYAALIGQLWNRPFVERGAIAADEHRNPLGYTGHPVLRASIERFGPKPGGTGAAKVWRWAVTHRALLSPGARVYLDTPHFRAYVHASMLWFPARVEVAGDGAAITDPESLAQHGQFVPVDRLAVIAEAGFSHALVAHGNSVQLVGLRNRGAR